MKKVLLMLVAIATIALVSCKKEAAKSASVSGADTTAVADSAAAPAAEEAAVPTFTGNAEADAKAVVDYMVKSLNGVKTVDDFVKLSETFGKFDTDKVAVYKDPAELEKYEEYFKKFAEDAKVEELMDEVSTKVIPAGK